MAGNGKLIPPINLWWWLGAWFMIYVIGHYPQKTLIHPQNYHPKTKTWNKRSGDNGRAGVSENWLVVWNMNFIFPYTGKFIIPTDEVIFFRGVGQPRTREYGYMGIEFMSWMQMKSWDIQSWVSKLNQTGFVDENNDLLIRLNWTTSLQTGKFHLLTCYWHFLMRVVVQLVIGNKWTSGSYIVT